MAKRISIQLMLLYVTFFAACQVVHSQSRVLFVKADNGTSCPHAPCKTLDWYSHNIDISFTSNTKMVFLKGAHSLETFIEVRNCHNFTMIGSGSVSFRSNGLPQPTSWINCHGASRSGLYFIDSSEINITDLGLDSCSGNATLEFNFTVYIALAFDRVSDIFLYQVVIDNTKGFGLHCDNIFGEIQVKRSVFVNAHGDSSSHVYGGNARFWFGSHCLETNLLIDTTWFLYGKETAHHHYYNASGLQVLIFCAGVHVMMNNITAIGNRGGINGGNLGLSLTDFGSNVSTITINNSKILNGRALKGGGLRFWSLIEPVKKQAGSLENTTVSILKIFNSIFCNNRANTTGGAVYIAHYVAENYFPSHNQRKITISKCKFVQNVGNGAAMEILKHTFPGYITHVTPQFSVHLDTCEFHNNSVPLDRHSSIMELIGTKSVSLSNCNFTNNHGSVFSLRSSNLNFYDSIHFVSNSAVYGAALKVCDSSLVFLHSGTNVLFFNNSAQKGGAIYAQQGCLDTYPACFFQPAVSKNVPIEEFGHYMRVKFVNNSARLAGDAIYGGSIDYCFTLIPFTFNGNRSIHNNEHIFQAVFDMEEQGGPSNISSNPRGVCFCNSYGGEVCKEVGVSRSVFPGQKFNISVTTIGQLNGTTYGLIDANIVNGLPTDIKLISPHSLRAYNGCINLTYRVFSAGRKATVNFTAVSIDVNAYYNHTNASLFLSLLPCPLGFKLTIKKRCECDPLLQSNNILSPVKCDINTQVVHTPAKSQLWFGCSRHEKDNHTVILP